MQAGLSLCWSHIPHCWESLAAAHIKLLAKALAESLKGQVNVILVLIAYVINEGSDEPEHLCSLARAFTARTKHGSR